MSSKPGAVGNNMPKALKGEIPGSISQNYKGSPRNAIPNYSHNPQNAKTVAEWTQNHMQKQRQATQKKQ